MILRYSVTSPYSRKVRLALAILGLHADLVPAETSNPADSLRTQAPLGKIPVLILDDGTAVYDSRVILDHLDSMVGGGRIVPAAGPDRLRVLTLAALCEGLIDAAILQVYEHRFRPADGRSAAVLGYQADKVRRALAQLEADPPAAEAPWHVGHIGLACALGYLDLRFEGAWRATHPRLVAWLDRFAAATPAYAATEAAAA